ncbi:uncharacterized protein LOC132185859 isoform X2 [Corylus avellana]|uniref:uncharacterized protein LOC132185859 isoform X2 n=1 Tax=Corylus avellana TaxID=13451 RepID=UPI002869F588|nr:uncharacterized protein LOC132185859 isoform X2 [Corylus avellana]
MLVTRKSFIFNSPTSYPFVRRNGRKFGISMAKEKDLSDNSRTQQETIFPLKISNPILARSVVALLGLGFIDAGGDWSRIGVISKETEDLLKLAAFAVAPLCIFLIFFFFQGTRSLIFFF